MNKVKNSGKSYIFAACAAGLAAGIIIKLFIFDVVRISGTSMEPAVPNNSYRIILKCAYGIPKPFGSELLVQWKEPDAGDIVLFIQQNKSNVKRCCFTAGMSMEYLASDGYYIKAGSKKIPVEKNQYEKLKLYSAVPDDMIFVLGDNTETSIDSREYSFIPVETVLGKVLCR